MMWNDNDTKYIIKRLILYILITGIVFFAGQRCAKAYSMIGYNLDGGTNVTYTNNPPGLGGNPWFIDYGLYASSNNISGRYLTIVADMSMNITSVDNYVSYISTARDTLTASNLRCGIGTNFRTGYDNTFIPTVENFNVYYSRNLSSGISTIRVQFIYKQQRTFQNYSTTNYSCWFERNPSNGLFAQGFSSVQWPVYIDFTGYNVSFSLSEDPNTALLQEQNRLIEIQNQLQQQNIQAINNNTQAINYYNNWSMEGYDNTIDLGFIDGLDGLFTTGDDDFIRQFILFPINFFTMLFSSMTSDTCVSYNLGNLYGTNLVLPCINYKQYIGDVLYSIIDIIMGTALMFGIVRFIRGYIDVVINVSGKATRICGVEVFK